MASAHVLLARLPLGLVAAALVAACNAPPEGPTITLEPAEPTTLDDVRVVMATEASDPNDDTLFTTYRWEVRDPDGVTWRAREDVVGDLLPAALTRKGQIWRVSVTVSDGSESTEVATLKDTDAGTESPDTSDPAVASVTILNTPPVVTFARLSPTAGVDTVGTVHASVGGEDVDGDTLALPIVWMVDGVALDVEDDTLTGASFDKGQEVWFEVLPSDGEVDGEAVVSNKIVIENTPPSLLGARVTPDEAFEETELRCEPVGWTDLDGDEPNFAVTWLVNGAAVGTGATLTGADFDRGDLVRCTGRPDDGDSLGPAVVSPVLEIGNTPPRVSKVVLDNTEPRAVDVLGATVEGASDVDGDPLTLTIDWYVDGERVLTGPELPPMSFVKGQEIYAVVTPSDGRALGEPVSSDVVTSVNSPPIVRSITLKPTTLYTDSVAFPSLDASDPDGDRITYTRTWLVDGSAVSHSGATLDGAVWFDKGDRVQIEIGASDGEDTAAAVRSAEVTVQNTVPSRPVIAIDPERPTSTDDLWCEVLAPSKDADEEDDLEYTVAWLQNGEPFTDTDTVEYDGDFVPTEFTVDGDVFSCTIEVTDGTETVSASSSVKVADWAGVRDFDNCGATGFSGPSQSQCDSAYADSLLDGAVTVDKGFQVWTVPADGTYRIEAWGAQGGRGSSYSTYQGALGARVRGDFTLSKGDTLWIAVGQMGQVGGGSYNAGGGGASWVFIDGRADGNLALVAAGGGGNGYSYYSASSCGGQVSGYPLAGSSSSSGSCSTYSRPDGYGGSQYVRYSGSYTYYYGGGGGGLRTDGESYYTPTRAYSALDASLPAQGGDGIYSDGGFGGGGPGGYVYTVSGSLYASSSYGGGGGGGYTGGGGNYYRGGGGLSRNTGLTQSDSPNTRAGDGRVTVDKIE